MTAYDVLREVPWTIIFGAITTVIAVVVLLTNRRDRRESRKASPHAVYVKTGSSWRFRIANKGKAEARNLHVVFPGGRDAIIASEIEDKLPISVLAPGECVDLIAAPHMQSERKQTVKFTWVDGASKSNEKTLDVHLL